MSTATKAMPTREATDRLAEIRQRHDEDGEKYFVPSPEMDWRDVHKDRADLLQMLSWLTRDNIREALHKGSDAYFKQTGHRAHMEFQLDAIMSILSVQSPEGG